MRLTKAQLSKIIAESVEELEYFGQGVKNLIDQPDAIKFDEEDSEEDSGDLFDTDFSEPDTGDYLVTVDRKLEDEILRLFGDVDKLGEGAFRTAYSIPGRDDVILKVARNRNGRDTRLMNKLEVEAFGKFPEFFPKVYMRHKEGLWVVVERVRVIEPGEEKLFGEVISKNFKFASYQFVIEHMKKMMISSDYPIESADLIDTHTELIKKHMSALFLDIIKCFIPAGTISYLSYPSISDEIKRSLRKILFRDSKSDPGLFRDIYHVEMKKQNVDDAAWDLIDFLDINVTKNTKSASYSDIQSEKQETLVSIMHNSVLRNFKFVKFMKFIADGNLDMWDIRLGNVATDSTHSRFMIIDAGIGN